MAAANETEVQDQSSKAAFAFGKNWSNFLHRLNPQRVEAAKKSLQDLLGKDSLQAQRFLDVGSGSGLFSLAANQLGAEVTSFDVDPDSVACTQELKTRFAGDANHWRILQGSLTDRDFLHSLDEFDIVYCWGVAHHTGSMWAVIDHLSSLVKQDGLLVLAIYNDELYISRAWRAVKQIYQQLPSILRPLLVITIGLLAFLKRLAITLVASLLRMLTLRNPLVPITNWAGEAQGRGMHGWYDMVDWVGGWPFEVARPEDVFRFLRDRGYSLQELTTSVGHGCNEFVFVRTATRVGSSE